VIESPIFLIHCSDAKKKCRLGKSCFVLQLGTRGRLSPQNGAFFFLLPVVVISALDVLHILSSPCFRGRSITTVPLLDFAQRHVTKGVNHLTEDVFVKGDGSWVTMHSGRKLLDFTSGIGVTNLGASGGVFFFSFIGRR
jgi:hypothetical protein